MGSLWKWGAGGCRLTSCQLCWERQKYGRESARSDLPTEEITDFSPWSPVSTLISDLVKRRSEGTDSLITVRRAPEENREGQGRGCEC